MMAAGTTTVGPPLGTRRSSRVQEDASVSTPTPGVAGWFPDPAARHEYRWWDGTSWSDQVASGGANAVDPLTGPAAPAAFEVPDPQPPPGYTGAQPTAAFGAPPASGGYNPPPPPAGGFGGPPPPRGMVAGAPLGPPGGPYGGPPPAGPLPGSSSNTVPLIVAAVLVVAALIGGVLLLTGGDDDDGDDVAVERDRDRDEDEDADTTDTTAADTVPAPPDTTAPRPGGSGVLGVETFSGELAANGLPINLRDLSVAAGTAAVIRVAPDQDLDASLAILGDESQFAQFSTVSAELAGAFRAEPDSATAAPGVTAAIDTFESSLSGAPTSELLASDAGGLDPASLTITPLPVVLFEEDPGANGTEELFVLFAPQGADVQLAVTGFVGSEGSFEGGVTFVDIGAAGSAASFAAAIIANTELASLLG
jgi:hypothetical protein